MGTSPRGREDGGRWGRASGQAACQVLTRVPGGQGTSTILQPVSAVTASCPVLSLHHSPHGPIHMSSAHHLDFYSSAPTCFPSHTISFSKSERPEVSCRSPVSSTSKQMRRLGWVNEEHVPFCSCKLSEAPRSSAAAPHIPFNP